MAEVAKAAGGAPKGGAAPPEEGKNQLLKTLMQAAMVYFAVNAATSLYQQYTKPAGDAAVTPNVTPLEGAATAGAAVSHADTTTSALTAAGLTSTMNSFWPLGTPLSLLVYLSTSPEGVVDFDSKPLVAWDGLTYGDWKDTREEDLWVDIPESVQNNGSLWADIFIVAKPDEKGDGMKAILESDDAKVAHNRKILTKFYPKKKIRKEKLLIASKEEQEEEEVEEDVTVQPIVAHWAKNLTLTIVADASPVIARSLSPDVRKFITPVTGLTDAAGNGYYYPILYPNDFWLLKENQHPINSSTPRLPLHISYSPISSWKWNLYAAMVSGFENPAGGPMGGSGSGAEIDEVKRMLIETNPWLLATTILVTILHMLFEFLAFSSDVQHWRKKGKDNDLVGVSLRSILTNVFVQTVIMLYLYDSSAETSFTILFGQGIGLVIEAWKITKVVDVKIRSAEGLIPYRISFEDKHELSQEEIESNEYDRLAYKIVLWGASPFFLAYAVYSLIYETHKSWWSYGITVCAQAIYLGGFITLIPQLIINYKLKSTAHIPMKAMVYKTLSTVVDDFFSFVVKMPWLHRLACFRDDVVFLILLYQKWIYRTDYTRTNEYGQVAQGMVEDSTSDGMDEKIEALKVEIAKLKGKTPEQKIALLKERTAELKKSETKKEK